jgi:antitoxin (DNA-binding transcriptional repressor) of toxin-antitoxin stability system
MVLVTLREAAEKLPELFQSALNGETVVIVGDDQLHEEIECQI